MALAVEATDVAEEVEEVEEVEVVVVDIMLEDLMPTRGEEVVLVTSITLLQCQKENNRFMASVFTMREMVTVDSLILAGIPHFY